MRQATDGDLGHSRIEPECEIDAELFEETSESQALAAIETDLEDVEPWQRLGDVLGRLTGEVETA